MEGNGFEGGARGLWLKLEANRLGVERKIKGPNHVIQGGEGT